MSTSTERMAERVMVGIYPTHPRAQHGTPTGYRYFACRCPDCLRAGRDANRATQARRKTEVITRDGRPFHPGAPHGTGNGYANWYCRCRPCTDVHAFEARARYNR